MAWPLNCMEIASDMSHPVSWLMTNTQYLGLVLALAVTHIGQQRIVAGPLDTAAGVRGQGVAALALVSPIHLTYCHLSLLHCWQSAVQLLGQSLMQDIAVSPLNCPLHPCRQSCSRKLLIIAAQVRSNMCQQKSDTTTVWPLSCHHTCFRRTCLMF